jgi:N6-adenosine-specific RNA methylase IME4
MIAETKDSGSEITTAGIYRGAKQLLVDAEQEGLRHKVLEIPAPNGRFKTIVIDPPWDMQKIEREVRPNQVGFDYPTMSVEELIAYTVPEDIADEDCHLFMWTTEKYLPHAFSILEMWGFRYVFTMVWHKSGGFQPYNLPQYNCEFVLYGRKGAPSFEDTKRFSTCFEGQRKEHSRKPDEFYQLINRVCPSPRIDIFSREKHDGFSQYGNETDKFS